MKSVRCCTDLSALVSLVLALNVASHGTFSILPNNQSSNIFSVSEPTNPQSPFLLNSSFTPSVPPTFADNASALVILGLDVNRPVIWTAGASGNPIGIQCRPEFGRQLDVQDCVDAWRWIPNDADQVTFAMRHTAQQDPDVPLPWRSMGCASSSYQHARIMQSVSVDVNVIMQPKRNAP